MRGDLVLHPGQGVAFHPHGRYSPTPAKSAKLPGCPRPRWSRCGRGCPGARRRSQAAGRRLTAATPIQPAEPGAARRHVRVRPAVEEPVDHLPACEVWSAHARRPAAAAPPLLPTAPPVAGRLRILAQQHSPVKTWPFSTLRRLAPLTHRRLVPHRESLGRVRSPVPIPAGKRHVDQHAAFPPARN